MQISPYNTIIVFDINGVLFTTSYWKLFKLLIRDKNTLRLIAYFLHPKVIIDIIRLYSKGSINEEYYAHLVTAYPSLAPCKSLLLAAVEAQKPIGPMIQLVYTLKRAGYELHILSNIGKLFFVQLERLHPELFTQFSKIMIAGPEHNYLSKPNPKMYALYSKECNSDGKQTIFIDDKKKNVLAAQLHGMTGILYKNPQQFKKELQKIIPLF